jgi:hypothetical protein
MNTILDNNMTGVGRVVRMLIGFALVSSVMFFGDEVPAWVSLFAVYPVITAIMAWEPLYAALLKARLLVGPFEHGRKAPLAS